MIYLDSLESIIESVYLEDSLSGKVGECNVFVNPGSIKYLTSKTVVITVNDYGADKISSLLDNGCKVISRVYCDNDKVEIQPYIMRINNDIMWNGEILTQFSGTRSLIDSGNVRYDDETGRLYFPKIYDPEIDIVDAYGNLTSLGWALQQVGINIKTDTAFTNLDLIKTGKIVL